MNDVCENKSTDEPWRRNGITTRAGERLSGDSGMLGTRNLPTIHVAAHVLDHVLQVGFCTAPLADQLIQIVSTRGPSTV
ncbi:hypothetical protein EHM76_02015 [bacterium]|nr:MAG: hypothetical protein EHM76_02015 [bacterium]